MSLYVEDTGNPEQQAIIFLHGGGTSSWSWKPVAELMSDYHCLIPDLPEHGQSSDEKPFTITDSAARVTELIRERTQTGRAHVVGLSLGAQIIVQLLSAAPDVIDHAVLSGTLVRPIPGASLVAPTMRLYAPFKDWPPLVRANMRSLGLPDVYFEPFSEDTHRLTTDAFAHLMRENMSFRLPDLTPAASVPVLILLGAKERGLIRQSARDLLAALPQAKVAVVPDASHNWPLAQPDLCAQIIRAWINHQPLPDRLQPLH